MIDFPGLFGLAVTLVILYGFWKIFFAPPLKPEPRKHVQPSPAPRSPSLAPPTWHDEVETVDGEVVEEDAAIVPRGEKVTAFFADKMDYINPEAQAMLTAGWMYDSTQRVSNGRETVAIGLPSIPPGDPRNPKSGR